MEDEKPDDIFAYATGEIQRIQDLLGQRGIASYVCIINDDSMNSQVGVYSRRTGLPFTVLGVLHSEILKMNEEFLRPPPDH